MTYFAICASLALASANDFYNCPPPIEDMTLYVTWYSDENGNGDGLFASLIEVGPEWHMTMVACDPAMYGEELSVNLGNGIHDVYCGDQFGYHPNGDRVKTVFYNLELDTWFTRIDVYWSKALTETVPEWGILYINAWERHGPTRYAARQTVNWRKNP